MVAPEISNFEDQDSSLFPEAKKGELTDIAGQYYIIEEREEIEKQKTKEWVGHQ